MQVTIAERTRRCSFRASARNGHRRVPSAGGLYERHVGLTNHARDDVLINQSEGKLSDNLETGPNNVHTWISMDKVKNNRTTSLFIFSSSIMLRYKSKCFFILSSLNLQICCVDTSEYRIRRNVFKLRYVYFLLIQGHFFHSNQRSWFLTVLKPRQMAVCFNPNMNLLITQAYHFYILSTRKNSFIVIIDYISYYSNVQNKLALNKSRTFQKIRFCYNASKFPEFWFLY